MKKNKLFACLSIACFASLVACGGTSSSDSTVTPSNSTSTVTTSEAVTSAASSNGATSNGTTSNGASTSQNTEAIATYTGAGDFSMGGQKYDGTITVKLLDEKELEYSGSFFVAQFNQTITRTFTADYTIVSIEGDISNVLTISKDYNDTTMTGENEQPQDTWAKFSHELNWQLNPTDNTMTYLTTYTGAASMAMGGTTYEGDLDVIAVDAKECIYRASFFVAQFNTTITRTFTADYTIVDNVLTIDDDYNGTTMTSGNEQPQDIWAKFADQKVFTIGENNTLTLKTE